MRLCPSPLLIPSNPTWKRLFYQRSQIFYYVQNLFFSKLLIGDVWSIISRKIKAAQSPSVTTGNMLKVTSKAEKLAYFSFCLLENQVKAGAGTSTVLTGQGTGGISRNCSK